MVGVVGRGSFPLGSSRSIQPFRASVADCSGNQAPAASAGSGAGRTGSICGRAGAGCRSPLRAPGSSGPAEPGGAVPAGG